MLASALDQWEVYQHALHNVEQAAVEAEYSLDHFTITATDLSSFQSNIQHLEVKLNCKAHC